MALSPLGMSLMMQPQSGPPNRAQVNPTDVLGAYNLATQAANQQYALAKQQQMATFGGLAGMGAAGIASAPAWYKLAKGIPDTPTINIGTNAAAPSGSAFGAAPVPYLEGTQSQMASMPSWLPGAQVSTPVAYGETGGVSATSYVPEAAAAPSLNAWLVAPDAAAGVGGSVAADVGAESALGAAAPAIADAGGATLADLFPFLLALA